MSTSGLPARFAARVRQLREAWETLVLDLVVYKRGKTQLIRGWDDLFTKITDDSNRVGAMKMSPYYRVFEDEAKSWSEQSATLATLNREGVRWQLVPAHELVA